MPVLVSIVTDMTTTLEAREYVTWIGGRLVHITRYDNHRRLVEDGRWLAARGEHYAQQIEKWMHDKGAHVDVPVGGWTWVYKNAATFPTPEEALRAATLATR